MRAGARGRERARGAGRRSFHARFNETPVPAERVALFRALPSKSSAFCRLTRALSCCKNKSAADGVQIHEVRMLLYTQIKLCFETVLHNDVSDVCVSFHILNFN